MAFFRYLIIVALCCAGLSISACAQGELSSSARYAAENVVVIEAASGEHKFNVELADEPEEQRIGLMYRTELAADAGMLFDFGEPGHRSMWMKNTLISLDMAFIDEEGVIRRIAANTTPRSLESIRSGAEVIAVLEVNGGTFARLNIEEGDRVRHPIFQQSSEKTE